MVKPGEASVAAMCSRFAEAKASTSGINGPSTSTSTSTGTSTGTSPFEVEAGKGLWKPTKRKEAPSLQERTKKVKEDAEEEVEMETKPGWGEDAAGEEKDSSTDQEITIVEVAELDQTNKMKYEDKVDKEKEDVEEEVTEMQRRLMWNVMKGVERRVAAAMARLGRHPMAQAALLPPALLDWFSTSATLGYLVYESASLGAENRSTVLPTTSHAPLRRPGQGRATAGDAPAMLQALTSLHVLVRTVTSSGNQPASAAANTPWVALAPRPARGRGKAGAGMAGARLALFRPQLQEGRAGMARTKASAIASYLEPEEDEDDFVKSGGHLGQGHRGEEG